MAVNNCNQQTPFDPLPNITISANDFNTLPNPTEAHANGRLQLESAIVNELEEYQSYLFVIRVWNKEVVAPNNNDIINICNITQEAGTHLMLLYIQSLVKIIIIRNIESDCRVIVLRLPCK